MLQEATAAVSRLDAEALEELERRAYALRDWLAGGATAPHSADRALELRARFRVFSDVVTAMGKDLAMLRRTSLREPGGEAMGVRWVL